VRTKVRESNRRQLGIASLGGANLYKVSSAGSANETKLKESSFKTMIGADTR
jgi:hypothetical protein